MSFEDDLLYFDKETCEYYDNMYLYEMEQQYKKELQEWEENQNDD